MEECKKLLFLGLSNLILLISSQVVFAAGGAQCAEGHWIKEPTLSNALFDGTLSASCTMTGGANIGIAALTQSFLLEAKHITHLVSGPKSEIYEGMNGVSFQGVNKAGPLEVYETEYVASDGVHRTIYCAQSSKIVASGFAGYTRAIDLAIDVRKNSIRPVYLLTMTVHIQIEQPWFALSGFFDIAKAQAEQQFRSQSANRVPKLGRLL